MAEKYADIPILLDSVSCAAFYYFKSVVFGHFINNHTAVLQIRRG